MKIMVLLIYTWSSLQPGFAQVKQMPAEQQKKVAEDCQKKMTEIAALVDQQRMSEDSRLMKGIQELNEKTGFADHKKGLYLAGGSYMAGALAAHLVEKRAKARMEMAMLNFFTQNLSESAAKGAVTSPGFQAFKKNFAELVKSVGEGSYRKMIMKQIPGTAESYKKYFAADDVFQRDIRIFIREDGTLKDMGTSSRSRYFELLAEKSEINALRPKNPHWVNDNVDNLVKASLGETAAKASSAEVLAGEKAVVELLRRHSLTKNWTGLLRWAKGALGVGGLVQLALAAASEFVTSARQAPDQAYAEAIVEDPSLLLMPTVMEENGMLTDTEKGQSMLLACLALQRYPDRFETAKKKLIASMEKDFQRGVNETLYGPLKKSMNALSQVNADVQDESKKASDVKFKTTVPSDATRYEVPVKPVQNPAWALPGST
ncbi:MAG: hypothetical protein JNL01_00390 [Bdellovibrionales bacterium]|nr:hypothetical protein [Bdellovibrionales bacterium]